jgi:hypothetical protein
VWWDGFAAGVLCMTVSMFVALCLGAWLGDHRAGRVLGRGRRERGHGL